jgi:two-component system sensor histidine kinase CpxA
MLKNGIFVKIYLCFWLTIILVLTTQIMLDLVDDSSPINRMKHHMVSSLGLYGNSVIAYYQTGNSKVIPKLAEQFKQTRGIDTYLLDSSLHRLDGSQADPDVVNAAERALKNSKHEHLRKNGVEILAVPIIAPDGKQFIVIGSTRRNVFLPPAPVFGNPNLILRISIVIFISGLICYLLAKYLVAPLVILRDATTRFAAGELSVRVGLRIGKRRDETTELAKDFDVMAERIESLMKLQRQLIGDISHELRSPLARLNVALDLARQNNGAEAEHALNRIEEETLELNEMIGELLTLTRLESGNKSIDTAQVNISDIVRDIVGDANFEAQGANRGVKLIKYDDCPVIGNSDLLKRAIENVVRNAIHYTDANTDVEVSVKRLNPDKVEVIVRDYGPGVPDAELDNIFRPFYRTSESRERQTGGTGLGLAISERAVQLHHGTIVAENAVGCGLSVCITLPLKS